MTAAWRATLVSMQEPPPVSTGSCPCSIRGPGDTPALEQVSTTTEAEVGVKFRTEKDGFLTTSGSVRWSTRRCASRPPAPPAATV
jgi:hypothetical protein